MSSLKNEEVLLTSNDGIITLTTHRVLQKTEKSNKEMMLCDFISYEVGTKRANYYKIVTAGLFIICIAASIWAYFENKENNEFILSNIERGVIFYNHEKSEGRNTLLFLCFLLAVSFTMFLISKENYLRLSGKFSTIEFSLKNLSEMARNKFINGVIRESEKRKKE